MIRMVRTVIIDSGQSSDAHCGMVPQPGMNVVSRQKRENQAEIITPMHPDMTWDVAKT